MTSHPDNREFSLIDEPWIPVLDAAGERREISLFGLFEQAGDVRMIACELPTQTFAILRLALAILHRTTGGPPDEAAWQALWRDRRLPVADTAEYLGNLRDRFYLLHPKYPFYQVADLHTQKDGKYGLERLFADVPNGLPFLTARAGAGLASIAPAEAARWLVHCQAYDPSGIKSGAAGDARVKGGKGYPIGVATVGALGGVHLEGATLLETLLLNLVPVAPDWQRADERDMPVWEREPHGAAEEADATRGPYGLLSLYTWQPRRIRLFGGIGGITGAMIANGDRLDWQDRHLLEPMSVWGRSGPREREQKRTPIYLPRPHDHTRALWRGLQSLLPAPPTGAEPAQRLSPMVVRRLAQLTVTGVVEPDFQVRTRATSVTYGNQQAVIDEVFTDALTMNVLLLIEHSALRTTAVDAAADAEAAIRALRLLAENLARAAGSREIDSSEAERAAERAYALLDRAFRDWLAGLSPDSDPVPERVEWQRLVRRAVYRLGRDMVDAAGPTAWIGRTGTDRSGRQVHYSRSQAEVAFHTGLARALPMAAGSSHQRHEEAA
ncbi:type I-E CRISPR-associated protein Cse1/CasA [Micromonospora sp. NBC_01796]|uniref:type I-E CRISPR-associated protein Cse1/CasA n=1 Tax=Micromonospora sp. NBC_01796 TaxID=2975987 RepID=UPI002DD83062|nr:type I-E CRISPR-associated protein Cse1/CasA [Micromonospora sp. NBC_01796]WSA83871.1 type I-E CRISPR-associated protein Cse1/CasA [Micromonospora sp. NBC_01796]